MGIQEPNLQLSAYMEKVCPSQGLGKTMGNRVLHKSRSWHCSSQQKGRKLETSGWKGRQPGLAGNSSPGLLFPLVLKENVIEISASTHASKALRLLEARAGIWQSLQCWESTTGKEAAAFVVISSQNNLLEL